LSLNARFAALCLENTIALIIDNFVLPTPNDTYCFIIYKDKDAKNQL